MSTMSKRFLVGWGGLILAGAIGVILFFVLPPLGRAGLWDPYELRFAEIARRIALNMFGRADLALVGADNSPVAMDTLTRPALPYMLAALGFKAFGVHDWAGRAPLAACAVLGVLATYGAVARLVDRRAGLYAAIVLATMPIYFVQARTMLGDIVTMSAVAASFGGLSVALLDRKATLRARAAWAIVALVGLGAGFASGGALLGLVTPLTSIGAARLLTRDPAEARETRATDIVAALCVATGTAVFAWGAFALARAEGSRMSMWIGAVPAHDSKAGFDRVVGHLGHALAPWSAFVPFAIGRLLSAPRGGAASNEGRARIAVLVGASVAVFLHAWLSLSGNDVVFTAPAILAVACGVALREFEHRVTQTGEASPANAPLRSETADVPSAVGLGTAVLALILCRDFRTLPEESFAPFGVYSEKIPESFRHDSLIAWTVALGLFAFLALVTWLERDAGDRALFDLKRYARILRAAAGAWGGVALHVYLALAVGCALGALAMSLGGHAHAHWVNGVPVALRSPLVRGWWLVATVPVAALLALPIAQDATAWLSRHVLRGHRGALLVFGGVASCVVLAMFEYPALAGQLSPKGAFETYARIKKPGEVLAVCGVGGRDISAYAGANPPSFADARGAFDWLHAAAPPERRFAVVSGPLFAGVNQLYREQTPAPHENVPVLDARSSEILLVASSLAPGESSTNPLDALTLAAAPSPAHPLDVDLNGEVEALGYDVIDESGKRVDAITASHPYRVRAYYRVNKRPTVQWEAFVHIDGLGRRQTVDHPFLGGKYLPLSWIAGDLLVDEYELSLPPNFTTGGYRLYYGFYSGDSRLKLLRGPDGGVDQIDGGDLRVR